MSGLSSSQLLFYGGIAVMTLAALGGLAAALSLAVSGCRLRQKLEDEYGKSGTELRRAPARPQQKED